MKIKTLWKSGIKFDAQIGEFTVQMDGKKPIGQESAPTPKELLLAAVAGCTGMDVVSLLKKFKQTPQSFSIEVSGELTKDIQPAIFKTIELKFDVQGPIQEEKVIEAVQLSQTKYCGVSAIISKSALIHYTITLNGTMINEGQSNFNI